MCSDNSSIPVTSFAEIEITLESVILLISSIVVIGNKSDLFNKTIVLYSLVNDKMKYIFTFEKE